MPTRRLALAIARSLMFALVFTAPVRSAADQRLPVPPPDPAAIGAAAAAEVYLNSLSSEQKVRSDAYFEGNYWLTLWNFLWSSAVLLVLLHGGWSARLRQTAARITRRPMLQATLYWVGFITVATVLSFPLTVYAGYIREHQYGLATQDFGGWFGDQLKSFGLSVVMGGALVAVLYAVLRRSGRTWWVWASVVTSAFLALMFTVGPVYIDPIFNTYRPLRDEAVRQPILRLARANGIDATEVWEMDASKQSTRISANVSGMFGTERITLNDNLLKRGSPEAVQAVMGHEMGHYVLNHAYKMLLSFSVVVVIGFAVIGWTYPRLAERHRARWGVEGVADPAGLPLLALILGAYLFVLTPVINTIVRTNEYEADVFGLNAARQPDGFAEAALLVSDYRKLRPGPWEEAIFFDHPSGRTRIFTAMRWKAEQIPAQNRPAK